MFGGSWFRRPIQVSYLTSSRASFRDRFHIPSFGGFSFETTSWVCLSSGMRRSRRSRNSWKSNRRPEGCLVAGAWKHIPGFWESLPFFTNSQVAFFWSTLSPQELEKLKATTIEMLWDRDLEAQKPGRHVDWKDKTLESTIRTSKRCWKRLN